MEIGLTTGGGATGVVGVERVLQLHPQQDILRTARTTMLSRVPIAEIIPKDNSIVDAIIASFSRATE